MSFVDPLQCRADIATVPGSAFTTPGYSRISYAASEERLESKSNTIVRRRSIQRLSPADSRELPAKGRVKRGSPVV
ncbi:hypothetical protein EA472_13155 [Natrarchaeobius oligotrophus]|uniref:Uncharacterized protein n=1 Tax=Natrarchaeobius chitinivorans TaxID=1679083 RepID=A0A3N6PGV2_NATCH|nr:hypothetical protein EA472_13155 [Natrarchaeobius chitinivorans]